MERDNSSQLAEIRHTMMDMSQRLSQYADAPRATPSTPLRPLGTQDPIARGPPQASQTTDRNYTSVDAQQQAVPLSCALQAIAPRAGSDNIDSNIQAMTSETVRTLRRHKPSVTDATSILKELALLEAANRRRKSTQAKGNNTNTQIDADWPDLYVYRLWGSEPTYDSLSLAEFVAGYLSIMEEVTTVCPLNVKLLKHILSAPADGGLLPHRVVGSAQVLNGTEHRRFTWDDTQLVMETKRTALARIQHSNVSSSVYVNVSEGIPSGSAQPNSLPLSNPVVCQPYQQLACPFVNDHEANGIPVMHCCAFCFTHNGFRHTHPQTNSRKAKEIAKGKPKKAGQKTPTRIAITVS